MLKYQQAWLFPGISCFNIDRYTQLNFDILQLNFPVRVVVLNIWFNLEKTFWNMLFLSLVMLQLWHS